MTVGRKTNKENIEKILEVLKYDNPVSYRKIAKDSGLDPRTVHRTITKFLTHFVTIENIDEGGVRISFIRLIDLNTTIDDVMKRHKIKEMIRG
jgi:predicted transcriptional regulator